MNALPIPSMSDEHPRPDLALEAVRGTTEAVDLLAVRARRIRDGDVEAFESLFRTTREPLLATTTRLLGGDIPAAHDVVQESFVRLWERRDEIDPTRSIEGWLHQTARNLALNRLRNARTQAKLRDTHGGDTSTLGIAPARPDQALARSELQSRLMKWIDALPERQREALSLTRFHGCDHAEAASLMGCSPRTVNNHLVRALRTLRTALAEYAPEAID